MVNDIESAFGINNSEPAQEKLPIKECLSPTGVNLKKIIFEWVLYCCGVIFILVSLYYFFSDLELISSNDIYDFEEKNYVGGDAYNFIISAARSGTIMTKGLIMAVLGCSCIIIGRLSAILNKMK